MKLKRARPNLLPGESSHSLGSERGQSLASERGQSVASERGQSVASERGQSVASERGQSLALMLVMLVALIGMVGLSVDGGRLYADRRQAQNAADNAALAGARAICADDPAPDTVASGVAATNGYNNDGVTNTVTVHNPPSSGNFVGNNEYIAVAVNSTFEASFMAVLNFEALETSAYALARCRTSFEFAVIALTTRNDVRGLQVVGSGDLIVNGGGVISNSSHPTQSLYEEGSGLLVADAIYAAGGVQGDGFSVPPVAGATPVEDPLAEIPPPSPPGPPDDTAHPLDDCTTTGGYPGKIADESGNATVPLEPGMYCTISGDSGIDFVLSPGIYYIDGAGSLDVTANSTISISGTAGPDEGVMIFLSPNAGPVVMTGNADVDIRASKSGPYAGMLFYADRSYTKSITMTGNSTWNAVGTIYAASSFLDLSGNGDVNNLSSMIIADRIKLGGNSDVIVNYDPGLNIRPPRAVILIQ